MSKCSCISSELSILLNFLYRRTVKDATDFSCRFNSETHQRCPIFSIGYILRKLQDQDPTIDLAALYYQVSSKDDLTLVDY